MGRPRYIHSPSQGVGRNISYPFRTGRPGYIIGLQNGSAKIYPFPFTAGRPRYIISLQNGSAGIYPFPFTAGWPRYIHSPSQRVGRDITYPFRMGRPGYIHSPSQRVSRDISTPLQNGSAEIYPFPITVGQPGTQDISPPSQGWPACIIMLACSTAQVTLGWIALYYFSPSLCFTPSLQSAYVRFTKNQSCIPCQFFPHPCLLPSIARVAFQALLLAAFCPPNPYRPMMVKPQTHPFHLIHDQLDFFFPPIKSGLGPQPAHPVT